MKRNSILVIILVILMPFSSLLFNNYFANKDSNNSFNFDTVSSDIIVGNYFVPGVTWSLPLDRVIKLGILNDMGDTTGEHSWKGAELASREINEAGGVVINGTRYYFGLVSEDTEEMDPYLDVGAAVNAANNMINNHDPYFVTGGFRSEALLAYQEVIMDAKIPFLSTGVADDTFTQNVHDAYSRYKYFFRVSPINGTMLTMQFITYILHLADYLNTTYGASTLDVAILREDLSWNVGIAAALQFLLPVLNPNITIVQEIAFPITADALDMTIYLNMLQSSGAQIVIPLISSPLGIMMSTVYDMLQPNYLLCGINTLSQLDTYWQDTSGSCNYEITMQSIYNVSKTSKTREFWSDFIEEYAKEPYYNAVGSYDAVNLLAHAVSNTQSFNSGIIVSELEKINVSNPFVGPGAYIAFTPNHDLLSGWPYGTSLFCQWYDGSKAVLSSGGSLYPESIPTGYLKLPPWGINGFGPSLLPGDFNVYNDADIPDTDGRFNLTWSSSTNADNYSIYRSNYPINYKNDDLILIADQTAISPFEISGLKTGAHFFVIVANNEYGHTLSDCTRVQVLLPAPGDFLLDTDADDPDTDGNFFLTWTNSDGADNYSIYTSQEFITGINGDVTLLADQDATSPFSITNMKTGNCYFVAVAYNATGKTLSNCINVSVLLPAPGDFILSSNAGTPDLNGVFDLSWTNSDGADNYSLYVFSELIVEINFSVDVLADQNAISPTHISGLTQGDYYYAVVAFNGTGQTMSNCLHIVVYLSAPGDFLLSSNAGDPDTDGVFNLTWSDSYAAENYSIYESASVILDINGNLNEIAYQTATSPFEITQTSNRQYYYVVVAYNENGYTLSNNFGITVQIPEVLIPGYDLFIILGMVSVVIIIITKRMKFKK
ncbi:MAG: Loki-CTERM sorting domain-containing protein [Promethearchaeota archaeon]